LFASTKSSIKAIASNNRRFVDAPLRAVGFLSLKTEKIIRKKLTVPPEVVSFRVSPNGRDLPIPIRMSTSAGRDQVSRAIYYDGWQLFEPPMPALLAEFFCSNSEGGFLDVGANTGLYALLCKALSPERRVYAFEPFSPIRDILKHNIALNSYATDIVVSEIAASDTEGTAELFIPTQEHGLVETSASLSATFKTTHSEVVSVTMQRLDDYPLGKNCKVAIMKIDVEGVEHRVLSGCSNILTKDRPLIFCEILPNSDGWLSIPDLLERSDYVRYAIHPRMLAKERGYSHRLDVHNYILCPSELIPQLAQVADALEIGRVG
jgi:FkbM family methyltransferase